MDRHYLLGSNASPYEDGKDIPSFSAVGALISNDGILGTATLIHVIWLSQSPCFKEQN